MGNCQAIDTATMVIQHPCGKTETMYWPVTANEVMKMNPGHYVALLITSNLYPSSDHKQQNPVSAADSSHDSVRITRIKLFRPTDTLVLGQVYRLITTQEVMKSLWAKKHAKMMKDQTESSAEGKSEKVGVIKTTKTETVTARRSESGKTTQVSRHEQQQRQRTTSTNQANSRSKIWQPSLKSISEATS